MSLVINEISYIGGDSGWVELYNEGNEVVDLSQYSLRTSLQEITLSGAMAKGEYRLFYVRFKNSADSVVLSLNGNGVDSYSWTSLPSSGSLGRLPDGSGEFRILIKPTPGRSNDIVAYLDEQSWGRIKALFGPGNRR